MPVYEYKFITIKVKHGWDGAEPELDHQEIIHTHARGGWRLIQIFAPSLLTNGAVPYFELIFERPKE